MVRFSLYTGGPHCLYEEHFLKHGAIDFFFFWQSHRVIWKVTSGIAFLSFMSLPYRKIQSAFTLANAQSITCLACLAVPLVCLWLERNKWSLYATSAILILGKIFRSQADQLTHPLALHFNMMSFCPPQTLVQTTDVCSMFCHLLLFHASSNCTPLLTHSCSALFLHQVASVWIEIAGA